MSIQITEEVRQAFAARDSVKMLGTVSKEGIPHVTVKGSIQLTEDGKITFLELLEKSQTQKNLVYALWFDRQVTVNVITSGRKSYQIKGIPYKAVTSGREFQNAYQAVQDRFGNDFDLSAIWYINIEEIEEESFLVRREKLEKEYPYELHVDRLAKGEYR